MLQITDGPHGLIVHFNSQSFPLTQGRAESTLTNLFMHIRCGISHARICEHLRDHQSSTVIGAHCPCCKLEGRILSGQGRKTMRSEDMFRAAKAHTGGRVEVRHIRPGISGAQKLANDKRLQAFENALSKSKVTKVVNKRIEDLI